MNSTVLNIITVLNAVDLRFLDSINTNELEKIEREMDTHFMLIGLNGMVYIDRMDGMGLYNEYLKWVVRNYNYILKKYIDYIPNNTLTREYIGYEYLAKEVIKIEIHKRS